MRKGKNLKDAPAGDRQRENQVRRLVIANRRDQSRHICSNFLFMILEVDFLIPKLKKI